MKFEVMMFAAAKEIIGADRVTVELGDSPTSSKLLEHLGRTYTGLKPLLPSCRLAVDDQYVADEFLLRPDHQIALIPPVSGG
jgi:molybdopterin converting factor small subunit